MELKIWLAEREISQAEIARTMQVSRSTVSDIVNHGKYPRKNKQGFIEAVKKLLPDQELPDWLVNTTEDNMLLQKQVLSPAAKRLFSLFRDPFAETAVQSSEDVFVTPDIRYVREAMYQVAMFGGMLAIWGESGAGKSILRRELIHRLTDESVVVIEPYVLAMEDNDMAGKTLKIASITEAILTALDPQVKIKRSPEAKSRQLHTMLKESSKAGYQHVVIIEEAHSIPVPTLKHLKRLMELESGFKKLISVILIGQSELRDKLSERNPAVREVVQRCELVELPPLGLSLEQYLQFKMQRAGKQLTDMMDSDAIGAVANRLSYRGGSMLYPLAVGNLMISAMNTAAAIGAPRITADIVKEAGK